MPTNCNLPAYQIVKKKKKKKKICATNITIP